MRIWGRPRRGKKQFAGAAGLKVCARLPHVPLRGRRGARRGMSRSRLPGPRAGRAWFFWPMFVRLRQ